MRDHLTNKTTIIDVMKLLLKYSFSRESGASNATSCQLCDCHFTGGEAPTQMAALGSYEASNQPIK